jgi:carbonic anhydrase/acetyltransferase-like protein (isoleucine patch superfamily)
MPIQAFKHILPDIRKDTYIDDTAKVIGKVSMGADCSVWPMAVLRGDVNQITIGKGTNIQDGTVCHVTHAGKFNPAGHSLVIGDYVTVGHGVILHGCTIGDFCLIGMGAIIMDGVVVPSFTIIGAGSLVSPNKILEPGLWVGNPARKKRDLTDEEKAFMQYSAEHYIKLKNDYLSSR